MAGLSGAIGRLALLTTQSVPKDTAGYHRLLGLANSSFPGFWRGSTKAKANQRVSKLTTASSNLYKTSNPSLYTVRLSCRMDGQTKSLVGLCQPAVRKLNSLMQSKSPVSLHAKNSNSELTRKTPVSYLNLQTNCLPGPCWPAISNMYKPINLTWHTSCLQDGQTNSLVGLCQLALRTLNGLVQSGPPVSLAKTKQADCWLTDRHTNSLGCLCQPTRPENLNGSLRGEAPVKKLVVQAKQANSCTKDKHRSSVACLGQPTSVKLSTEISRRNSLT